VTLGVGVLLIPRLGLPGAAIALLGSALVQLVANLAVIAGVLRRMKAGEEGVAA